ncbi:Mitochondrial Translation Optimization [Ascosphaera pollenicola]|nr:Mitochondrial Translation Optimization [Ascosphaera pollenicola]
MRTLQMETPGIMPDTSKVGLDLLLDPAIPYLKFGNEIVPPRASSTVAETLSVLTGFAGAYGMLGSAMTKAGTSKERPDHFSATESFSAAVKYTTYRNGGSAHGWQYIFYIPLVTVCLESTVIFLYACRSLFASGKNRQILDFSDPHYFFQLGLATSLYKRSTPENIEKDFAGRWTILHDAHDLQYVQSLADQLQEASAHHQAEMAEPRDVEGGHGNAVPTPAILSSIVGWFKGRS